MGVRSTRIREHRKSAALARSGMVALAACRPLGEDEIEELAARIDAERAGRELIAELQGAGGLQMSRALLAW